MKIVIFGANEIGSLIATELFEDHDIIVIDSDSSKIEEFSKLDISYITGNGSNINVLSQADIKNADIFIAATSNDEANIVACMTVKQLSEAKVACLVSKPEYVESLNYIKNSCYQKNLLSIDFIIWPEELLTQEIFRIITVPEALDVEYFAGGRVKLLEYKIKDGTPMVNKKIKDLGFDHNTLIVGITRNELLFIPTGESELLSGDKIIFMGTDKSLDITASNYFVSKNKVKSAALIGGGSVGFMLADYLEKASIKTKIIEKNEKRCEFLSQTLNSTLVLQGDGTNLELLEEEEIGDCDVVISVTNNDEKNLLCSLLAKQLGAKKVITRVSKATTACLFEKVGVDVALSLKEAAINEIKNRLIEVDYNILATVDRGQGKVIEINVCPNFKDILLKDIKLPARAIVAIIQRQNKVIIPKGDTMIQAKDNIMIFTASDNAQIIKDFFIK